jgi:hypothetical protein
LNEHVKVAIVALYLQNAQQLKADEAEQLNLSKRLLEVSERVKALQARHDALRSEMVGFGYEFPPEKPNAVDDKGRSAQEQSGPIGKIEKAVDPSGQRGFEVR